MPHDLTTRTHPYPLLTSIDRCWGRTFCCLGALGICTSLPPRRLHPANRRDTQRMRVPGLPTPNEGFTLGVVTPNGAAIRAIRELRGLSLRRLAHLIGRDPGYLSRVEIGRQGAGDETLRRIAGELRIPLDAITREKTSDQQAGGDDGDARDAR
ncbi:hypothetical protein C0L86_28730 [Streptomyces sp. SCA2-2]|nr:hypothetical protein C0L86_28730 [Streptomyces sp. SCA2-2]